MKNNQFDKMNGSLKYINRFVALKSAEDMIKYFPNVKEIAESMSMYYAVKDNLPIKEIKNVVVIGDGVYPRTAILFCYMTKLNCVSIDPDFRMLEDYNKVNKLKVIKSKIEDVDKKELVFEEDTVIILPHSHAPINICWKKIIAPRKYLIKMECCTHDKLPFKGILFKDPHAITTQNQIYIWDSLNENK